MSQTIVQRMEDYFQRQIAWFETLLADLRAIESELGQDKLDALLESAAQQDAETQSLAREYEALKREWNAAASIPDSDRTRIQTLAQRAASLAEQLRQRYHQGAEAARQHAGQTTTTINNLRKGRSVMRKYTQSGDNDPNYTDHNA